MTSRTQIPAENVIRLLVESAGLRVSSARLGEQTVWIKRFDAVDRPFFKRVHARLSAFAPISALRSSPPVDAEGVLTREVRKQRAFAEAGIPVAEILYAGDKALILSDAGLSLVKELDRLREVDGVSHDDLLVAMAAALGTVHARGLCHGRPHPRDMFLSDRGVGFLDFEEEPEAAMPLPAAQARDAWLLFMHVGKRSCDPASDIRAFEAYRDMAPEPVVEELVRLVAFFRPFVPLLKAMQALGLGGDGKRILITTELLGTQLANRRREPRHRAETLTGIKA